MDSRRILFAATAVAGAMFLSGIAQANQIPEVVITENSSNSLTATLNGASVSVTVLDPDVWRINFTGLLTGIAGEAMWVEPDNPRLMNLVTATTAGDSIDIFSDDGFSGIGGNHNGVIDTTDFTDMGAAMYVTVIDNADIASVPDATATLPLLSLSLAGLGILARCLTDERKSEGRI